MVAKWFVSRFAWVGPMLIVLNLGLISEGRAQSTSTLMKYPRVRAAYAQWEAPLRASLAPLGLELQTQRMLMVGLKSEAQLQIWLRGPKSQAYVLWKSYPICSSSGQLGPKRRRGDGQVPEGLYTLNYFNPTSDFHLSMRVSYPNASDRIRGHRPDLGDNIYIHGNCVSIGCIPITDEGISELFVLADQARQHGPIPVLLLPTALDSLGLQRLQNTQPEASAHIDLWRELHAIYQYFLQHKRLPNYQIDPQGRYQLRPSSGQKLPKYRPRQVALSCRHSEP